MIWKYVLPFVVIVLLLIWIDHLEDKDVSHLLCNIEGKGITRIEGDRIIGKFDDFWVFDNGSASNCVEFYMEDVEFK